MQSTLPTPPFASMFAKPETVGKPKSLILYGAPGARKTSTAGGIIKVPGVKRVLYIDIDNGSEVFLNDPDVYAAVEDGRINIVPIDKLEADAFGKLQYFLGRKDPETGVFVRGEAFNAEWGYDTIIIDALDVAQEVAVDWYLANTFNEHGKQDTRKAWGEIGKWTSDLMWSFQNHPTVTGIAVMHSKEGTEDSGAYKIKPKLSGSVKDTIAGIPSLVAYLSLEVDKDDPAVSHLIATIAGDEVVVGTKNRYSLPGRIEDFDLPMFYKMVAQKKPQRPAKAAARPAAPQPQQPQPAAIAA